jgi:hypothetical protein
MKLLIPKYRVIDFEKDYFCEEMRCITIPLFDSSANTYFCTCCNPPYPCIPVSNRYQCDICEKMYKSIVKKYPKKQVKLIKIVPSNEICSLCFEKNKFIKETKEKDLKARYDTIHYNIIREFTVNNYTVCVIHEYDNVGIKYDNYRLLCIENGQVILNYILDSYNPYFGIRVIEMSINLEKTQVSIKYSEKHSICDVKLKLDRDGTNLDYIIDGIICRKQVGEVIEFIVDGKKSKNNKYFDD